MTVSISHLIEVPISLERTTSAKVCGFFLWIKICCDFIPENDLVVFPSIHSAIILQENKKKQSKIKHITPAQVPKNQYIGKSVSTFLAQAWRPPTTSKTLDSGKKFFTSLTPS